MRVNIVKSMVGGDVGILEEGKGVWCFWGGLWG